MRVLLRGIFWLMPLLSSAQTDSGVAVDRLSDPMTIPQFPGGWDATKNFIEQNLKYPCKSICAEGKVFVGFVVEKDGSITSVKTVKGIHPVFDAEAERVIRLFPKWIPGKQYDEAVSVKMVIPVEFKQTQIQERGVVDYVLIQEEHIYVVVDTMPEFPGGNGKMVLFLSRNLKYPALSGSTVVDKVLVGFFVEKDGNISNVRTERGINIAFDKEAERVVRAFPKWSPGKLKGRSVRVKMIIPIVVCLKE